MKKIQFYLLGLLLFAFTFIPCFATEETCFSLDNILPSVFDSYGYFAEGNYQYLGSNGRAVDDTATNMEARIQQWTAGYYMSTTKLDVPQKFMVVGEFPLGDYPNEPLKVFVRTYNSATAEYKAYNFQFAEWIEIPDDENIVFLWVYSTMYSDITLLSEPTANCDDNTAYELNLVDSFRALITDILYGDNEVPVFGQQYINIFTWAAVYILIALPFLLLLLIIKLVGRWR